MKKHLVPIFFFALATAIANPAQAQTNALATAPAISMQQILEAAEQPFGISIARDNDRDWDHSDCDKCRKKQKNKKNRDCKQRGNHYGKHKNHHEKHSCSCDCHDTCYKRNRDCDDDRRCERNSRNWDDDRSWDRSDRDRDRDDRRYTGNNRSRDDGYRQQPRTGPRNPSAKVKSRPAPTAKPASKGPAAKRKVATRPVRSK